MKLNAGIALAAVMMAIVLVTPFAGQTPKPTTNDPSIGTWVLNNQKSKLGGPAPNAFVERYELRADGFILGSMVDGVLADKLQVPIGVPAIEAQLSFG